MLLDKIAFIIMVIGIWWLYDEFIVSRKKQKQRFQDRYNEALEYCDKLEKDLERLVRDYENGKYEKGKVGLNSYDEDRGDAADCLLSYVRSLHMLRGPRDDKDIRDRIATHLLIARQIEGTRCDFVYHGLYDEYKNKRISDIVMELMQEPYE